MLQEMKIKNFALIKEISIRFAHGLNILTGETGAGKSIIIDALSAILGEKMTVNFIRSGEDRSVIEGTFLLEPDTQAERLLDEMGIEVEGRIVVIRRELGRDGKGRSFINGVRLPTSKLKDVGNLLVDIHGQNEHQAILRVQNHLDILDLYGQNEGLMQQREKIKALYKKYTDLSQILKDLQANSHDKEMRAELLGHAVQELQEANILSGEEEELKSEARRLSGAEKLFSELSQAHQALNGAESEEENVMSMLGKAETFLQAGSETDDRLLPLVSQLQESLFQIQDVNQNLGQYLDKIEFSPQRLEEVESRLDLMSKLLIKYKAKDVQELLEYQKKAQRELDHINLSDEQIQNTRQDLRDLESEYSGQAEQLSEKRKSVAQILEQQVNLELKELVMENTLFRVQIDQIKDEQSAIQYGTNTVRFASYGVDQVEFFIAAGAKEQLKPLRKIASGGEMSRIMLAIKKLIIDKVEPQSMVFDEVDAGVGGKVAERVGRKLKALSKGAQVICITHLPQIAAMADIQFFIAKDKDADGRMITQLKRLTKKEREQEIARMMSGEKITDLTLQHAREMIAMVQP